MTKSQSISQVGFATRTITLYLPYRLAKPQLFRLDLAEPCRKRQTSIATPAEPTDLPWGLESTARRLKLWHWIPPLSIGCPAGPPLPPRNFRRALKPRSARRGLLGVCAVIRRRFPVGARQ